MPATIKPPGLAPEYDPQITLCPGGSHVEQRSERGAEDPRSPEAPDHRRGRTLGRVRAAHARGVPPHRRGHRGGGAGGGERPPPPPARAGPGRAGPPPGRAGGGVVSSAPETPRP